MPGAMPRSRLRGRSWARKLDVDDNARVRIIANSQVPTPKFQNGSFEAVEWRPWRNPRRAPVLAVWSELPGWKLDFGSWEFIVPSIRESRPAFVRPLLPASQSPRSDSRRY